jgi:hypothetical protein
VKQEERPYPIEPLMAVAELHRHVAINSDLYSSHRARGGWWHQPRPERLEQKPAASGYRVLLEVCGLTRRNLMTIRARGGLTDTQADECAIRLGHHPWEIWGEDWWDGDCAKDRTDVLFAAIRSEVA